MEPARERLRATGEEPRRRAEARRAVERARVGGEEAERRRELLAEQLERTPPWRRRERAGLRAGLARAGEDIDRLQAEGRTARDELARLGPVGDDGSTQVRARSAPSSTASRVALAPWRAIADRERARELDRLCEPPGRGLGLER